MLNPQMKGWGIFEHYRRKAEQLRAERAGQGEATCLPPGSLESKIGMKSY
jgi:hypothetical protein